MSTIRLDADDDAVFFCRALYDYPTNDPASLPLRKDDILRVLHRLESGWWDGLMDDGRRGWFPSNYVAVLSSTELGPELAPGILSNQQQGGLDGAGRFGTRTRTMSEDRIQELDQNNRERLELSNESWVPQVTPDSQVFYINPETGRLASEIPSGSDSLLTTAQINIPRISLGRSSFQLELTPVERLASVLQQSLLPAPSPTVGDLETIALENIGKLHAVGDLRTKASLSRDREISHLFTGVVSSVRELLRATVPLSDPPPSHLLPRDAFTGDYPNMEEASQLLQGEIKLFQNKVIATLAKLVLSARDTGAHRPITSGRAVPDSHAQVDEQMVGRLERAVASFAKEVMRRQDIIENVSSANEEKKALRGVLQTAYIGLGLVGAGSGGTWRGFGWVTLEPGVPDPSRVLGTEVVAELRAYITQVNDSMLHVKGFLSQPLGSDASDAMLNFCQDVVTRVSLFTQHVNDINMALYVDIDDPVDHMEVDGYARTVQRARELVRSLEVVLQAVYDDSMGYLLSAQSDQYTVLVMLQDALRNRLNVVIEIIQDLLATGSYQMELSREHFDLSIGLRSSRLGMVSADFAAALNEIAGVRKSVSSSIMGRVEEFDIHPNEVSESSLRVNDSSQNGLAPSWRAAVRPLPAIDPTVKIDTPEVSPVDEHDPIPPPRSLPSPTRPPLQGPARLKSIPEGPSLELNGNAEQGEEEYTDEEYEDGPLSPEINVVVKARADKIGRIFGGDAPQSYINRLQEKSQPSYMRPDYDKSEISLTPDGVVRGGTLPALVEHLTAHELAANHSAFLKAFLMTYSSFTDLNSLFDLLVKRYRLQAPPSLTPIQLQEWTKLKQEIVRVRVMNVFKQMISDEDFLDKADYYILDRIREFIESPDIASTAPARSVKLALNRRMQLGVNAFPKFAAAPSSGNTPSSIVPKTKKELTLLDIDTLELARQLTIRENNLFSKVRPAEYLQRSKESKSMKDAPDNLARFIQTSNQIPDWIKATVLAVEDHRRRATVLKYFINLADKCRSLSNFSCVFAITTGLNSVPIRRLNRTWEHVAARHMTTLAACEVLMDRKQNFANYRTALAAAQPPCIPYIGRYLTELNFIHNGNKNMLNEKLINFAKRQKVAETIAEIRHWQSSPYNFNTVPQIQTYIEQSLTQFADMSEKDLDDRFYKMSLEREPKEGDDEKMARLLQESGFL